MARKAATIQPLILKIAKVGVTVLRKKAKNIANFNDTKLQELISNMLATLKESGGLGLAATQIYQPLRAFIFSAVVTPVYPQAKRVAPTVAINPKINFRSSQLTRGWEGCLSLPGIRGIVPRSEFIEVEYFNRQGKKISQRLTGLAARVFQHEYDHLEGIIFIDRVESTKNIISEEEFQKIVNRKLIAKKTSSLSVNNQN